ncbi:MAG TPA: hypothetical protein VN704_11420 [Verrucomicrobiae bacterium]|nr:hypothetical protein [Verrucomicrobiae bacterium]
MTMDIGSKYFLFAILLTGLLLSYATISFYTAEAIDTNKPNSSSLKGAISSIQNDEKGNPAWIVAGVYKLSNYGDMAKKESPMLNATFYMIKLDGTSPHTHTISNFKMIGSPKITGDTTTINGTSTITMKGKDVTDVPTSIKILDKSVISFWLDPSKVMNHFGNTVIYGTHHLICVEKTGLC